VHELTAGLLARGHRPRIITSHPGQGDTSVEDGVEIVRHRRPPDFRLTRRGYEEYMTHWPLSLRSLMRGDDEIAHAVFPTDALAAVRWAKRTGRPSVLQWMGIPDHEGLCERRKRLEITHKVARESSAVVGLSKHVADAFWRWLGVEARVIHPGVDLERFQPAPARAEVPTIFCAAAPAVARKRVAMLVSALRLVRAERPDAELRLERPSSPPLARELERSEGVVLVDLDEPDVQLPAEYGRAWVSALASTHEAFCLVLVEAMACGTPVVGTAHAAIPEVIDRDEVGRLFDGDERALAHALLETLELAEDPATAKACRARAGEFSTDRMTDAYVDLYEELLR
jgi:glycosyltransferase involved in cell wall biosynthesis